MEPGVEEFLNKFSKDTEKLVKNIAQCWQIAQQHNHVARESLKKFQKSIKEDGESSSRLLPSKSVKGKSQTATQTCACKEQDVRFTAKTSEKVTSPSSLKSTKSLKQISSKSSVKKSNGKSRTNQTVNNNEAPRCKQKCNTNCALASNYEADNHEKQMYCSRHGYFTVPNKEEQVEEETSSTPKDLAAWAEKFSEAQKTIQLLRNTIMDLDIAMKQKRSTTSVVTCGTPKSPMTRKRSGETICKLQSCPFGGQRIEKYPYTREPKLPDIHFPEVPRLPPPEVPHPNFSTMHEIVPRHENEDPFQNMPLVMPNAVPLLPGSFVATPRAPCSPCRTIGSCRRVSFK